MAKLKYTIPNSERKHYHLVVSKETHEVVKLYAKKWEVSITEATQRLLTKDVEEMLVLDAETEKK